MAKDFDYGALWCLAQDALDAVNDLMGAIFRLQRPPLAPGAVLNPRPHTLEKRRIELKTLPERRAKAVDAIRKAGEKLIALLAEDRFIAPVGGVWPPSAPEIARRLSNGLEMAASAARAVSAWKDNAYIDKTKRYAVDSESMLRTVVAELERRPEVAELAYQRQVGKLRAERPDWSAAEALASWQSIHEKKDAAVESPTGFLGGEALADALGVHPTRRKAFIRQLERQRIGLGNDCWHEVHEPQPNSPKFLYLAGAPEIHKLAAKYKTPKSA
ncbi:MAG: hypothetical protein JXB10_18385 [Pirellulales bacterium]|nr:hypothetical protein [Pirellulales bacterium]